MGQRHSTESDRYYGRRRVPTVPGGRYAAVITIALLGAGGVAAGAAVTLDDAKATGTSGGSAVAAAHLTERGETAARTDRGGRAGAGQLTTSLTDFPELWRLPLHGYTFSAPYGIRWSKLHAGIDLAAPEGTPYRAVHAGEVTTAGWYGGYGYTVVVDHGDGTVTIYGHSSRLLVEAGQRVQAGDALGLVGYTGHAYGAHLHLEIHINGEPLDPVPFLRDRGVDVPLEVEEPYAGAT